LTNAGQKYLNRNPVALTIRCFNRITTVLYSASPKPGQQKAITITTCNWRIQKNTFPKPREFAIHRSNQNPVTLTGFARGRTGNNLLNVMTKKVIRFGLLFFNCKCFLFRLFQCSIYNFTAKRSLPSWCKAASICFLFLDPGFFSLHR
jgi:hypothetical protein